MTRLLSTVAIAIFVAAQTSAQTTIDDIPASVVIPVIHLQKLKLPAIAEYDDLVERYQELLGSRPGNFHERVHP